MLDITAPVRQLADPQPINLLWRGFVQVLVGTQIGPDPFRALMNPAADAAHTARKVLIPLGDTASPGWFLAPKAGNGRTIVMAHGTSAEQPWQYCFWNKAFLEAGFNVLTMELDGHGENPRLLRCPDIEEDVPAAIAYARTLPEVDPERIALMGVSLGAACAVNAAARDLGVKAVLAVSPPHKINIDEWGKLGEALGLLNPEIATTFIEAPPNRMMQFMRAKIRVGPEHADEPGDLLSPGTRYAVHRALRHLNPLDSAANMHHAPLLVVSGQWDNVCPSWQAHDLYERAVGPKSLLIVPRRNHFSIHVSRSAVKAGVDWFRRWV